MPAPASVTIVSPKPRGVAAPPSAAGASPRAWPAGQVLLARVVETGPGGTALLRVGSEHVQAQTRVPVSPGQQLRLQVEQPGPPAVLRVLADAEPVDTPASRALRSALPDQRPVGESLAALQRLSVRPPSADAPALPEPAKAMLSDLLDSLPRPRDAGDAARLEAMVRSSGLFHEAGQARAAAAGTNARDPAAAADLKARLAAVAQALDQGAGETPGSATAREAQDALRAALARIETHQALSARGSGEHAALWRMDLPLADDRGPHGVEMRIRRDGRRRGGDGDAAPTSWVVEVTLEPPGGGPVHARVTLIGERVFTLLTTDDEATFERLVDAGPELERLLADAALDVGGVSCRRAPLPGDRETAGLDGLLRCKA